VAGLGGLYVGSIEILIKPTFPGYEWQSRTFLQHLALVETEKVIMHCYHLSQKPHNGYSETLFEYGQYLEHLELYTTQVSLAP
jgi:hypothetical protein